MSEFRKEDFPQPYDQIAEELGVDATIKLARMFSGEQVYFPKFETLERPLKYRKIINDFNGYNYRYLSRKYHMTVRAIREIVKPEAARILNEPVQGQMSLLDNE